MKNAICGMAVAGVLLPTCVLAQEDLSFSGAVDFNYKQLDIEIPTLVGVAAQNYKPDLWTLNLSPSVAWHRLFLSAAIERTLGENTVYGSNGIATTFTRSENGATLGYNIWAGLSGFVGYLNNSTHLLSAGTGYNAKYAEHGPYYGLAYSYSFANRASVSASAAHAQANGKINIQVGGAPSSDVPGEVRGTSYGLTWSAPLAGSLFYRIGYKATRYDFNFTNAGVQGSVKQNYDAFYLGMANYF